VRKEIDLAQKRIKLVLTERYVVSECRNVYMDGESNKKLFKCIHFMQAFLFVANA
jgi:hypothetical protein